MDLKLLAWGLRRKPVPLPRLWLFTDDRRLPDPRGAVASLPRGRAGVVLRHDNDPARAALGRDLARICRARRLTLVVDEGNGLHERELKPGESYHVRPLVKHRMIAITDCDILEASTPELTATTKSLARTANRTSSRKSSV